MLFFAFGDLDEDGVFTFTFDLGVGGGTGDLFDFRDCALVL